jgi:N-acetylglucosamine malate deacetylase 2
MRTSPMRPPVLCVAAHPDDETIGAGAWLARVRDVDVVHVTDGAPRDPRFRARPDLERGAYAELRREEALRALEIAGIPASRVRCLGSTDLEAMNAVEPLAAELARLVRARPPATVLTHPYEGGHPDHDTAALLVYAAIELVRRAGGPAVAVVEMTSYFSRAGHLVTQRFLTPNHAVPTADSVQPAETWRLPPEARATKRGMLAAFASQRATLEPFTTEVERTRAAPRYRFDRAPHAGPLWYELRGLGSGEVWRTRAVAALGALGVPEGDG